MPSGRPRLTSRCIDYNLLTAKMQYSFLDSPFFQISYLALQNAKSSTFGFDVLPVQLFQIKVLAVYAADSQAVSLL